jgi:hypothetical protein
MLNVNVMLVRKQHLDTQRALSSHKPPDRLGKVPPSTNYFGLDGEWFERMPNSLSAAPSAPLR